MEQSKSKIDVTITVHGKGKASAEIFRHFAPTTVNRIVRNMPLHGRVSKMGDSSVCIITQIVTGSEKGRKRFARGDVALLPFNGLICIFLKDSGSARPLNPIGRVVSGLDVLDNAGRGDTVTLEAV